MRTEEEMMKLILTKAENDERIRAVIMNGSRVNPNVKKDQFQDYDIVYIVTDIESFTSNHSWIDYFGKRINMQMPEEMVLVPPENDGRFAYLMLFEDGNRIDLTLVPVGLVDDVLQEDSLSVVLNDKDNVLNPLPPANDSDYVVTKPSSKEFADCFNEFWWVSTNVAKGIWREELPYAKAMMEGPLRTMLVTMLEWYVGTNTKFTVSTGKYGKFLEQYLEVEVWKKFVDTYSDGYSNNLWLSLVNMCHLFREIGQSVAQHLNYDYPASEEEKVLSYLTNVKQLPKRNTDNM